MFKYGGIKYTSEKKIVGFLHADKAVLNLKAAGMKNIKVGGMDGQGLVHIYFNDPAILDKLKKVNEVNEMTTGTFYDGVKKIPAKDKFFAGAKKAGKALGKGAGKFAIATGKTYNATEGVAKKVYAGSHKTVVEHRRRVIAREEYKAKKGELKVAQHIAKQQLPFKTKTAYRGLSDRGLSIKKKKSKGGFF